MPNMEKLVQEKGQIKIPDTAQSALANMMLKTMNESNKETFDIIAVFNSGSNEARTDTKKYSIASVIKALQDKKS
jgi:RND superfamily putative drug exporter